MHLPPLAAAYVQATNNHDSAAFLSLFSADSVVDDAGRLFHGLPEIQTWSDHDIMAPHVTLEVLDVLSIPGEITLTTVVDGTFDRTGLPDPVVITHHLAHADDKISRLSCRLAVEASKS